MKTIKSTLMLLPALFLLFFWIGLTGNLSLSIPEMILWPLALALVASISVTRFAQSIIAANSKW